MRPLVFRYERVGHISNVTLVDCPHYESYEHVARQLYSGFPKTTENTDILVIRPPVDRPVVATADETARLGDFLGRFPKASIHLLYSANFEIKLSENVNPLRRDSLIPPEIASGFLQWLRSVELRAYVQHSSAVFPTRQNFVYRSPSGRYVNNFLRVGNVQMGRQPMDAIFFWLLPYLKDVGGILTETWSISSLALNAARLVERYAPNTHSPFRVDMLSAYFDGSPDVAMQVGEPLTRVTNYRRATLVLFSTVMTGESVRRLREEIRRASPGDMAVNIVALYRLNEQVALPSLCDLFGSEGDPDFNAANEAPAGTTVIDIDRHTYFPLQIEETAIPISASAARPAYSFFNRYKGTDAICLHRDSVDLNGQPYRHHGIFVDVLKLLETRAFTERLTAHLSKIPHRPALIVAPPHEAGAQLSNFASAQMQQKFGAPIEPLIHQDLHPESSDIPKDIIRALGHNEIILIIDDVSVTGQRLSRYQEHLRKLGFQGQLYYLIGVARPESDAQWTRRERDLTFRVGVNREAWHKVFWVEKLILPDWTRYSCPWCKETDLLSRYFEARDAFAIAAPVLIERLRSLENSRVGHGLIRNAFWRSNPADSVGLTMNSLFLEHDGATDADIIAAVCASLQHLRTVGGRAKRSRLPSHLPPRVRDLLDRCLDYIWPPNSPILRLESTYPHVTVIDSADYFGETFNDAVLRLAIIRAANRAELERWKDRAEEARRRTCREYLLRPGATDDVFRFELMVAMQEGKIPRPSLSASDQSQLKRSAAGELALAAIVGVQGLSRM